jgi:hypothetical protein
MYAAIGDNEAVRLTALICLSALGFSCAQRRTPEPLPAVREVRQAEAGLGFDPTGNFHREGGRKAFYLCYATGRLELPDDYTGLKVDQGRDGSCKFDLARLDVFVYPAEALAGRETPVTGALAAAEPARRDFVVAHEDFHEQQGVRELSAPLKEAVSMLAGFLTAAGAAELRGDAAGAEQALRETDLFLEKARRMNAAHARLREVYAAYLRKEIPAAQALARKQEIFDGLAHDCGAETAEPPRAFHPCPAALNNAGLAFDVTYTREYPRVHAIFEEAGRDPKAAIEALKTLAQPGGAPQSVAQ